MVWFKIICMENFDSVYGPFCIGDELNTIDMENIKEARRWAYNNYGPYGEDIKHKVIRC